MSQVLREDKPKNNLFQGRESCFYKNIKVIGIKHMVNLKTKIM